MGAAVEHCTGPDKPECTGPVRAEFRLSLVCCAAKPVGCTRGIVVFTPVASRHVDDTNTFTPMKHADLKASENIMMVCLKVRTSVLGLPESL